MSLREKEVLGVKITVSPKEEILEEIKKCLEDGRRQKLEAKKKNGQPLLIFTPNPEIIAYAQKDAFFKKIVNSAHINLPDGWGVSWAIKKLFGEEVEKIAGVDFMLDLCRLAQEKGFPIGLIGGRSQLALKTFECLKKRLPGLKGWAEEAPELELRVNQLRIRKNSGSFSTLENYFFHLQEKIRSEKIKILFAAFGFPKQEYFLAFLKNYLAKKAEKKKEEEGGKRMILMGVGGAFAYLSGEVPRAPKWLRERNLEWFYRLFWEPWRLPRQIRGSFFFAKVLAERRKN